MPQNWALYKHDDRYLCSLSRDPDDKGKPYFGTACTSDIGGPVFYKDDDGKFLLLGIHTSGAYPCGDATQDFQYDYAVLMKVMTG